MAVSAATGHNGPRGTAWLPEQTQEPSLSVRDRLFRRFFWRAAGPSFGPTHEKKAADLPELENSRDRDERSGERQVGAGGWKHPTDRQAG